MKLSKLVVAAAVVAAGAVSLSTSAFAQAKEQFFPLLSYRTGPYAPNGTPWQLCSDLLDSNTQEWQSLTRAS